LYFSDIGFFGAEISAYIYRMRLYLSLLLFLVVQGLQAARVDSILVYSAVMRKQVPCVVVVPDSYKKKQWRYPVVYLLHGWSGNQRQWLKDAPQLKQRADEYHLILVLPDGGYGSWYFDSPVDSTCRYETFISKELVTHVDLKYRTIQQPSHRAITGLSMGGHGAMYLSMRHPDVFGQAGSICGGVDIRPFPKNWDLPKYLGEQAAFPENWESNTVIQVAKQLKAGQLRLIIDCGVGDFFLEVNRALHQQLLKDGIPHDYTERPGEHNKDYWSTAIDYQLLFFRRGFDQAVQVR
jgi:S-formylglutathione hydrolase FrmB